MMPDDHKKTKEELIQHHKNDLFRRFVGPFKEALISKAVELALQGDQQMLTLLLERVLPKE